jgi:DNA (cytosine-5)-methyltransferase 1
MLVAPTGQVPYFTLREAARLQTFPDKYFFPHSWTETLKQLRKAVPVALAEVMASSIRSRVETVITVRV